MAMTKQSFINMMAESEEGLTKAAATRLFDLIFDQIREGVERDGSVAIAGFGTFSKQHMDERNMRNIQTGEIMTVAAKNRVKFVPAKKFKDKVNE